MVRTHTCNDLRIKDDKKEVTLIGWSQRIRDHGGKKFIDLRDREGLTQIVFDPDVTKEFSEVETFKREYLIEVNGKVRPRPDGTINKKLGTGEVEVIVDSFKVISKCDILPFELDSENTADVNEEIRMQYRYLDLRRPEMFNTFKRRSKFTKKIRDMFDDEGYIEVDTPILTASSPEGARDFLVPSRKHSGSFFALPQAPQMFKQILMVSGFEKYYQIATCFRDEDLRKDRQYEFKQVDMEASFISQEELFEFMNNILNTAFKEIYDVEVEGGIQKLSYFDAMERFGCDKPDLRINMDELVDISDIAKGCGFSVFANNVKSGGIVKGLRLENGQELLSRKDIDKLIEMCQKEFGAKGLAWMKVNDKEIESSITKFFNEDELKSIREKTKSKTGDLLFFVSDSKSNTNDILDGLRRHLAERFDLMDKDKHILTWIVDFPLFHFDEGAKKLDFEHNPFTMPLEEDIKYLMSISAKDIEKEKDKLLSLVSDCYDLVYNGVEIASGAKRIYLPELQSKMFELCGFSADDIEKGFGWFVKAYNYSAPPHRGCALGLDRIITLLEGKASIREVIAFPRNKHGFDPMTNSPAKVDNSQLKDLGIKLDVKEEKKK
jgi:aspartyl-tRNA synthetase